MKETHQQKGITLVALVITIIILLILAGISIQAITNTGLFEKAKEAENESKMASAKETITMLLNEWKIEKITTSTKFEDFFNQKVTENNIDGFEKSDEEEKYDVYKDGYVVIIDAEGNIIEDIQKSGPRPKVSNIKITTDGTTEVSDNSQKKGTKLQINFDSNIENGTIKSVTPTVPYTTNGTETEVTFTIVGTVDGIDYRKTQKISVESKYKKPFEGTTVEEAIQYADVLNIYDNKELQDVKGNKIVVPAGFKIVSDSTTNNAQTVDKGIVIEDATETATAGSQFVWIPVGTITKADGSQVTINLNRYTFDSNGNPTAKNDAVIDSYYQELATSTKGNTTAKNIEEFKTKASAAQSGGFYIGRYEARTGTARSAKTDALTTLTTKSSEYVYNYVTQIQAANLARNMYQNATTFTSDLMNSYAWDTATLFLQTCGNNTTYSRKNSVNTSLATTGTNNQTTKDVQCNVYDMASNTFEWTTETYSNSRNPCVYRGGRYDYSNSYYYTSLRNTYSTSDSSSYSGFRPLLYV